MRKQWLLFLTCPILCFAAPSGEMGSAQSEEEALCLRRIADFWQEGEYQIAKIQIEEFLAQFPESEFSDMLCAALGDLLLREKNYSSALNYYALVKNPELKERFFLNRMQCLYQMQWYPTLADECEGFLQKESPVDETEKLHTTYFLAIALYQQCLNAIGEPEALQKLAKRAQPYYQTLFESELSEDVSQAFAHLCCILKDFSKASGIYEDLAQKNPALEEDMLFQAGVIQSEYDKELALNTFTKIAHLSGKRATEANYNRLVLLFDLGKHEELTLAKEELLKAIPAERTEMAHLYLGRSFLSQKKFADAIPELQAYISSASTSSETLKAALASLLEASYQSNNLAAADFAIAKWTLLSPDGQELPKALFSRAQILKKNQQVDEARKELQSLLSAYPQFQQKAQAIFELSHLDYREKAWQSCRRWAKDFLAHFPEHDLARFARHYLVSSSAELAAETPLDHSLKEQLISDIESQLTAKEFFTLAEEAEWRFLMAKTYFELARYEEAIAVLHSLLNENIAFEQESNARLLLALCYRDGRGDLRQFCEIAEQAVHQKANLIQEGQIHASLFNAYLERAKTEPELLEKSAKHLYLAFQSKTPVSTENLLWLADFYYNQWQDSEVSPCISLISRTASVLEYVLQEAQWEIKEETLFFEPAICRLSKAYGALGRLEDQAVILEKLNERYKTSPALQWSCQKEARFLLGQTYLGLGKKEEAALLFDWVVDSSSTVRAAIGASASLYSARLKIDKLNPNKANSSDFSTVLAQLKTLVLQKTFSNEPVHLEAALDYIDLLTKMDSTSNPAEKRLSLLTKTKADFERTDDLLSKDYHASRSHFPQKDLVYRGYMRFIDAELLSTKSKTISDLELQKELQAKAKLLLLQIIDEKAHPDLVERARQRLTNNINEHQSEAKA